MKNRVLYLGRFAPPMHGAARMNELYFGSLNAELNVQKIKINYSVSLEELGRLNFRKFFGVFIVLLQLLLNLVFFRPHVVCFEMAPMGLPFLRDSLYVWFCKLFKKKITFIFQARGVKESTKAPLKRWYYRRVFKNTKAVVLSKSLYEDLEEVIAERDVYVVPNAIPDELTEGEFANLLLARSGSRVPVLLFLSNLIESKGPLDTLEICNMLNREKKEFKCYFVGNWKEPATKKRFYDFIKKNNLSDKCDYLGPKYGEEKKEILAKSNFLIFPTKYEYERFPLVVLEALMAGIPVVSYNTGAIEEIIDQDYLGYVSRNNSPKECFQWLNGNLNGEHYPERIREVFKKRYLISHSAEKLKTILLGL